MLDPRDDGVKHINIYSKGSTKLGVMLSNFYLQPFKLEKYGHFASIEGFWYWLSTGKQHDVLRSLWGYGAKVVGRKLERVPMPEEEFRNEILYAIKVKILTNSELRKEFKNSTLPFVHYYYYGPLDNAKVVEHDGRFSWLMDFFEKFRAELKQDL